MRFRSIRAPQPDQRSMNASGSARLTSSSTNRRTSSKGRPTRLATKLGGPEAERLLTAAAVNRPLALLRHLLRTAHEEWEVLPAAPKIRLEKEPQGRLRWLTGDEIKRLLEACGKSRNRELRAAVIVERQASRRARQRKPQRMSS